tara:strand:- start:60914 stop:61270 length:357 start_codon:yes stop_codon:yes gene_type:complete
MTDLKKNLKDNSQASLNKVSERSETSLPKKGPLSFLSGSLTSLLLSVLSFRLSQSVVLYFTIHSNNYTSPIAQSVASGFKTLIIGMCFLATFTFAFIGLGLSLVFIRSLFDGKNSDPE